MYYYYRGIYMLCKDFDCVRIIGRDAEKLWDCGTVVLMNARIIFMTVNACL